MPPRVAQYVTDDVADQRSLLQSHLRDRGYLKGGKPTHNPIPPLDGSKYKDFSYRSSTHRDSESEQFGIYRNLKLNDQDDFGKTETFRKSPCQTPQHGSAHRNLAVPDFKPTAKYVYPIERRPRGDFPLREFFLTLFLIISGLFFVGLCYWSYLTQKEHEFTPFLLFAAMTLVPGLYQGSIFICAIFELNEVTYNDIPRAPGWT